MGFKMSYLKNLMRKKWFYPFFILFLMLVTYELFITKLGFYWDDWEALYLAQFDQLSVYWNYFLLDRPFSGALYFFLVQLLGTKPLYWQLTAVLFRWIGVIGMVWALNGLWPKHRGEIYWMGIFMAVFPSFTQQAVAMTYMRHFLSFALFSLSLALLVWALRNPKRYTLYTALSILCSILQMLIVEYFAGLELLKPVVIWHLISKDSLSHSEHTRKTLRLWFPQITSIAVFLLYRFVLLPISVSGTVRNEITLLSKFAANPLNFLISFISAILKDCFFLILRIWIDIFTAKNLYTISKSNIFSILIGFLCVICILFFFWLSEKDAKKNEKLSKKWFREALLLGSFAMLLGGAPVWATGRQIAAGFWSDRLSLAPMVGTSIILITIIVFLIRSQKVKNIILALLVLVSISSHIKTAHKYTLYWETHKDYYWQLHWRAPALEEGTAILGPQMPFSHVGDYSIGFALNHIYAQEPNPVSPPYFFINSSRYVTSNMLGDLSAELSLDRRVKNVEFTGNTNTALGVTYNPARGCLRVMDPIYTDAPTISDLIFYEQDIYNVSNPNVILESNGMTPPETIFGKEPEHNWCYYYQKADLARQNKDWEATISLAENARQANFYAKNGTEYIPFIEGYAHLGNWETAYQYTQDAQQRTPDLEPVLCSTWIRIMHDVTDSDAGTEVFGQVNQFLGCETVTKSE
jgi:hypothetical protein